MEQVTMRPLTQTQYGKVNFRKRMRELSYPEKVHCVIQMQKRLAPILAARGIIIRPWSDDDVEMRRESSVSSGALRGSSCP